MLTIDYPILYIIINKRVKSTSMANATFESVFKVPVRKALKLSAAHYPALVKHKCKGKEVQSSMMTFRFLKRKDKQASQRDSCSFWMHSNELVCSLQKTVQSGQDDLFTAVLICCTNS